MRKLWWSAFGRDVGLCSLLFAASACGSSDAGSSPGNAGAAGTSQAGAGNGQSGSGNNGGGNAAAGAGQSGAGQAGGTPATGDSPTIAGCAILPANHLFNTPTDGLPTHAGSADFMKAVGTRNIHLDLGMSVDTRSEEYYGIPYNVVHSKALTWSDVAYRSSDPDLDWDPTQESDCAVGAAHTLTSPCTASAAPKPQFPIPTMPLVEGGIVTAAAQPYGDHHLLLLDADTCGLWELYHVYPGGGGNGSGWDVFGSAYFDLKSNQLRTAGWTSADAAGFPILPLLLRADEASSGEITHALRFTIDTSKIRNEYTWPARHLTNNGTLSATLPPMGQAFRIKSSYVIPQNFNTQSRAILQALKTYGMYLADGGSAMYIQGEPSAAWQEDTFEQVQSVSSTQFEAIDLAQIAARAGFDENSAAVP